MRVKSCLLAIGFLIALPLGAYAQASLSGDAQHQWAGDRAVSDRVGMTKTLDSEFDPMVAGDAHQTMEACLRLSGHAQLLEDWCCFRFS